MDNFKTYHLSPVPISHVDIKHIPDINLKNPEGFWYGFGKNWIQSEKNYYLYQIDIHEMAYTNIDCPNYNKICLLQSTDDYILLNIKYSNWNKFSQDFAGIEFRDKNRGCIFRSENIINKITLI